MKHYDEHKLELFVRKSDLIAEERKDIELHLSGCNGCRELADQISQFYSELDTSLRGQVALPARKDEIVVARPEVVHYSTPSISRLPARMWAFALNRPIAASISTIGAIAIVVGAMSVIPWITSIGDKNRDLFEVHANAALGRLEALNRNSDTVWTLPWISSYQPSPDDRKLGRTAFVVADPFGNGEWLVFSIIPELGVSPQKNGIVIVQAYDDEKNQTFATPLGEDFAFVGKPFAMNFLGRGIVVDDFSGKGVKDIIVGVDHYDSPSVIYRLDGNGNVLGSYWHYGRVSGLFSIDLRKDGRKQLVLCGINDVLQKAMLAVLNPERIKGKSEATTTPGFGFTKSVAEEYYITFPSCDLWDLGDLPKPRVTKIIGGGDRFEASVEDASSKGIFRFVFSSNMDCLSVTSVDDTKRNYEQLKKEGKLHGEINDSYLEELRRSVEYWDGIQWSYSKTRVLQTPK
ncbi:MAG: hypothetical protein V1799_18715 [bacterium]